jgi:HlyD family secretion protein
VQLSCDGCGAPVPARISFLSPETEYTAPVIYSRDQRDKLVVMVEARPDDPRRPPLRVGQPLEVRIGAPPAP